MTRRLTELAAPLRLAPIRSLFVAQVVSGLGDWAGRLALAVLVFDRSSSAGWAAAVTVVSLVPWLGLGQLLTTFADRYGTVRVMIAADLVRAALFALMLIPGQPVWVLLGWAFLAGLCVPPFAGAKAAALVDVSPPEVYPSALSLYAMLAQAEILVGYALGGVAIALVGAPTALAVNAATFVVSAWLLRPLVGQTGTGEATSRVGWAGVRAGAAVWRADPICGRALLLFVGVAAFMILPEALVVPVAADVGMSSGLIGVLAALVAVGSIIGIITAPSGGTHLDLLRRSAIRALLLASLSAAFFLSGVVPAIVAVGYIVSGIADAISVPTNQVVGERLPKDGRAAAMSVAMGVLYGTQVVTVTTAGAIAEFTGPLIPLAGGMLAAAAVSLYAALRPVRVMTPVP